MILKPYRCYVCDEESWDFSVFVGEYYNTSDKFFFHFKCFREHSGVALHEFNILCPTDENGFLDLETWKNFSGL